MTPYQENVLDCAEFILQRVDTLPKIAFLTGTGLGESISSMDVSHTIPYADIPHFPISTVDSHAGNLIFGTLETIPLMVMQGRFHLYEGYTPLEVTFPIRVMQELGIKTLIISNASGGLNPEFSSGDIMVITDHINLTGQNPLRGPNPDEWGIRFPDMTQVYDQSLAALAVACAKKVSMTNTNEQQTRPLYLQQGVYAGLMGPSLETPAETRYLKTIGADAVGFSTVMEAIAAVHAGMKILGLATITNINNPDAPEKASLEAIIHVAQTASATLNRLLTTLLPKL